MRKNPVVNKENEFVMYQALDILKTAGMSAIDILQYIGLMLYVKKKQIDIKDIQKNNQSLADFMDQNDTLHDEAMDICTRAISKTSSNVLNEAMLVIGSSTFAEDEYLYWFDFCASKCINTRETGIFDTPTELGILADAFICSDAASVFVPFGETMQLATSMNCWDDIESYEPYNDAWLIGMLRLGLAGKLENVHFSNSNINDWTEHRYDAIVSFPPFNMPINMQDKHAQENGNKKEESELIAANRFIESTFEDAIGVFFMSPSILWGESSKKQFRKWAMDNHIIDTVILLPKNLLDSTSIPLACIILKKQPHQEKAIRFIDASSLYTVEGHKNRLDVGKVMNAYHMDQAGISTTVGYDSILENDYSWNIPTYLQYEEVEVPEGYTQSYIDNLVTVPKCDRGRESDKGKLVKIPDLAKDWAHPCIQMDKLTISKDVKGCCKLTQTAIVMSLVMDLKASIIEATEENPVWMEQHIFAIIPNQDIDIKYLCMVLATARIPSMGIMSRISKTAILRYKIAYPDLNTQQAIYTEARKNRILAKAKEDGLQEVIDQMKSEYINEVRARKHDMMPHLRQLSSARKNMEIYLSNKDSFDDEEFMNGMKEEIANQKAAIDSLTTILKIFSRESLFGEPEVINIDKFLYENYPDGSNYTSDHDTDYQALANAGFDVSDMFFQPIAFDETKSFVEQLDIIPGYMEGVNVYMAKDDLQRLCDNIFMNAVKHGFTDPSRKDYSFWTNLTVDTEKDMFQIDFSNNGTPLPKGLDKLRYGLRGEKAGATGGTGEGGYIVKSIVEHYGGDYDIFSENRGDEIWTTVRIYLPIYRNEHE